jgi:hypothetical protein
MTWQPKPISHRDQFDNFSLWLNDNNKGELNPGLYHFSYTDIDKVIYRLRPNMAAPNLIQICLLEAKSYGKQEVAHKWLFRLLDAVLWYASGRSFPVKAEGETKEIELDYLGFYVLKFSGKTPSESDWITWNREPITLIDLFRLLRLEIHPRTKEPLVPPVSTPAAAD